MDLFFKRRSIRKYSGEPVSDSDVTFLLKAAMAAPSAGNEQPWEFIVVKDRPFLQKLSRVSPHASMTAEAAVAVVVCGDLSRERHKGFWVQDCSAAIENLLLAAASRGLGAVWLGIYPRQDRIDGLRALLGIPGNVIPLAMIAVGHPGETKPPADRYDPARVHYESW
jgi:nitroreductase